MKTETEIGHYNRDEEAAHTHRACLLENLPVTEHRYVLGGISTAVLEGGQGQPIIMLHGPGETSIWWMQVIPKLTKTYRVVIPDLPGHGASMPTNGLVNADLVLPWLQKLIEHTCSSKPALIGHILGGAIAGRFAINYEHEISRLVLVDSLGLDKFRPSAGFAFGLARFFIWPNESSYIPFLKKCLFDKDDLQRQMGELWKPFLAYNLECAQDPDRKAALRILMKELGIPKIPPEKLNQIDIPTALIWGRHDLANKLSIAEAASDSYKWPLHIIEDARDDPKLERPEAFIHALRSFLEK